MALGTTFATTFAINAQQHAKREEYQRLQAETAQHAAEQQKTLAEHSSQEAERQKKTALAAKTQAERSLSLEAEALRQAERARTAEAEARHAAETSLSNAEQAKLEAEQQRTEAQWQTYVARLQPMMYRWEQQEYGQLESMLDQAVSSADGEPDFRGWEWHYLRNLCRQRTSPIDESSTFARPFRLASPDETTGCVFVINNWKSGQASRRNFSLGSPAMHSAWSDFRRTAHNWRWPTNSKLASLELDPAEHKQRSILPPIRTRTAIQMKSNRSTGVPTVRSWQPGPTWERFTCGTQRNGELVKAITLLPHNFPCNDMHWHPVDHVLAVGTRYGQVFAIDIDQDKPAWIKKIDRDYVRSVRWNPSGTMLAGGTGDGSDGAKFVVWDRQGDEKMRSAKRAITGGAPRSTGWTTKGWLSRRRTRTSINFTSTTTKPLQTIRVHDRPMQRILHYGDSRQVITSTDEEIRTTRIDGDVTLAIATPVHKFSIKGLSWAPDSRRVATVSWDRLVAITDVAAGEVLHNLEGHANGAVNDVAWSPDGLRVASCDHSGEFRGVGSDSRRVVAEIQWRPWFRRVQLAGLDQ